MILEGMPQRSQSLGGITWPLAGQMQGLPVGQQCGERQGFVRLGFLAFGCGINTLCHITHNGAHRISRLGQRDSAATADRDAALLPMEAALREIGFAATRRDPHAEPSLFVVENEHVALAFRTFQTGDAVECELHSGPPADPARRHFVTSYVAQCQ
jgi:hypothetical protein